MKYYHRTDIFICESLKEQEKIYGKIIDYLRLNEEDKNTCKVIGKNEILEKIRDSKYKELRFACITRKTSSIIPCELFSRGIPMLFFNLGSSELFEEFRAIKSLDKGHIQRMIYEIDHLHEIRGAINWVHTYYYHLREQDRKNLSSSYNRMGHDTDQIENCVATEGIV